METTIYIPRATYQKVMHWVHNKDKCECSGLMSVEVDAAGDFHVLDAFMVTQLNDKAETEMDPNALGKLEYEHFKNKRPGELKLWWHSHVDMNVFWSNDDKAAIKQNGEHGYYLATVFNKKGDILSCLYQSKPYRIFLNEIETMIYDPTTKEQVDAWNAEYLATVTIKKEIVRAPYLAAETGNFSGPTITTTGAGGGKGDDDGPASRAQAAIEDLRSRDDVPTHPDAYEPLDADEQERLLELSQKDYGSMTNEEWEELEDLKEQRRSEIEDYREMYYEHVLAGMGVSP